MKNNINFLNKWDHPEEFLEPENFWDLEHFTSVREGSKISLMSYRAVVLIHNIYNYCMSQEVSKNKKIITTCLLNMAALSVVPMAYYESIFRLALTIITAPFLLQAFIYDNYDYRDSWAFIHSLNAAVAVFLIPTPIHTICQITFSTSNTRNWF